MKKNFVYAVSFVFNFPYVVVFSNEYSMTVLKVATFLNNGCTIRKDINFRI